MVPSPLPRGMVYPPVGLGFGITPPPLWVWGLGSEQHCCSHCSCIMSRSFATCCFTVALLIHFAHVSKSL